MPKELNNEKKQPMKAKELQDLIDFIAKSGLKFERVFILTT